MKWRLIEVGDKKLCPVDENGSSIIIPIEEKGGWSAAVFHDDHARLIAAAPELLAVLRYIAIADPSRWYPEMRDQFRPWAQSVARDAIAKATGEKHE